VERPRKRKREHDSSDIIEILKELREGQEEQKSLLKQLLEFSSHPASSSPSPSVVSGPSPPQSATVLDKGKEEPILDTMPFPEFPTSSSFGTMSGIEVTLFNLVKVAETYNAEERSRQVKQFIAEHPQYLQLLTDLIAEAHNAGVPVIKGTDESQSGSCLCLNCPYKQQLSQLEEFYVQYLSPPSQTSLTSHSNISPNGTTPFRSNGIDF
jgi:hypothetical protein